MDDREKLAKLKVGDPVCFRQPTATHPDGERPYRVGEVVDVLGGLIRVDMNGQVRVFLQDGVETKASALRAGHYLRAKLKPIGI